MRPCLSDRQIDKKGNQAHKRKIALLRAWSQQKLSLKQWCKCITEKWMHVRAWKSRKREQIYFCRMVSSMGQHEFTRQSICLFSPFFRQVHPRSTINSERSRRTGQEIRAGKAEVTSETCLMVRCLRRQCSAVTLALSLHAFNSTLQALWDFLEITF